jgi:hypothetical protein
MQLRNRGIGAEGGPSDGSRAIAALIGYVRYCDDPKHPPGPPMDLANMREQGVHHLIAFVS